jgi:hypothetical protein
VIRFVVTELEGYRGSTYRLPGLSCHVIDTLCNRRIMASYRSEDFAYGGREASWRSARAEASAKATELNDEVAA